MMERDEHTTSQLLELKRENADSVLTAHSKQEPSSLHGTRAEYQVTMMTSLSASAHSQMPSWWSTTPQRFTLTERLKLYL